jgi:hypothetical protein
VHAHVFNYHRAAAHRPLPQHAVLQLAHALARAFKIIRANGIQRPLVIVGAKPGHCIT